MAKTAKEIKALVNDIFLFGDGSFDQFEITDLIEVLVAADDAYANDQPILPDENYDALRQYVVTVEGDHMYFLGVGSQVRGGKVKLPYPMGSLTQAYQGDTQKWVAQHKLQNKGLVLTEKLDGISTLIIYGQDGKLQIAYSRGDGIEGADITRHISKIAAVPKQVSGPLVARAEIIFKKSVWEKVKKQIKRSGGAFYKNARNATAGLMNASESDPIAYANLSVVGYEILNLDLAKNIQLDRLEDEGFEAPRSMTLEGANATDAVLTSILNKWRDETDYEIDGIVLEANLVDLRKKINPTKSTLNPEYARKFKVADASNLAESVVVDVEFNVSKNGYKKPRVKINPTELVGVTVQHATGFNAAFIKNNRIGPGAVIRITRSGDVIPFILGVVKPMTDDVQEYDNWFEDKLSEDGDWHWTKNSKGEIVDAVLDDAADNDTVKLEQLIDFFAKVGVEHLGEGNLKTVFDAQFTTIVDVINLSEFEWTSMIGANGKKIFKSIREKLKNVPWYIVAGAHPSFGRGVGVRKMKKLYVAFSGDMKQLGDINAILTVDGFEKKTATKISTGFVNFIKFHTDTSATITFAKYEAPKSGGLSGATFLFTGFRDKGLEKQIEEKGGKISSSVSSKLTYLVAADITESSGKLNKARELGTNIISREDLIARLETLDE